MSMEEAANILYRETDMSTCSTSPTAARLPASATDAPMCAGRFSGVEEALFAFTRLECAAQFFRTMKRTRRTMLPMTRSMGRAAVSTLPTCRNKSRHSCTVIFTSQTIIARSSSIVCNAHSVDPLTSRRRRRHTNRSMIGSNCLSHSRLSTGKHDQVDGANAHSAASLEVRVFFEDDELAAPVDVDVDESGFAFSIVGSKVLGPATSNPGVTVAMLLPYSYTALFNDVIFVNKRTIIKSPRKSENNIKVVPRTRDLRPCVPRPPDRKFFPSSGH